MHRTQTALQEDSSITLDENTRQSHCWTADQVWQGALQGGAQLCGQSALGTDWRSPGSQGACAWALETRRLQQASAARAVTKCQGQRCHVSAGRVCLPVPPAVI